MKSFKTFFPLVLESQAVSRLNFFLLLKYISRPITELLLPVVPRQQTETEIILVSFQTLCLSRNSLSSQLTPKRQTSQALYRPPCSISPPARLAMWPKPIRYFLIFSFLFFIPHPIKASCLLPYLALLQKEIAS